MTNGFAVLTHIPGGPATAVTVPSGKEAPLWSTVVSLVIEQPPPQSFAVTWKTVVRWTDEPLAQDVNTVKQLSEMLPPCTAVSSASARSNKIEIPQQPSAHKAWPDSRAAALVMYLLFHSYREDLVANARAMA